MSPGRRGRPPASARRSEADLLAGLRRLQASEGYLSARLINNDPALPHSVSIVRRFGTLLEAYRRAGLGTTRAEIVAAIHDRQRRLRSGVGRLPLKTPIIANPDGSRLSDEGLLAGLRRLHATKGYISERVIAEAADLPTANFIRRRFGCLRAAYARAGLPSGQAQIVGAALRGRSRSVDAGSS